MGWDAFGLSVAAVLMPSELHHRLGSNNGQSSALLPLALTCLVGDQSDLQRHLDSLRLCLGLHGRQHQAARV